MAAETSVAATDHLAQVKRFLAEQRGLKSLKHLPPASDPELAKLPESELAKLCDLCEDIAHFGAGAYDARLERRCLLGTVSAWFEYLVGASRRRPRWRGRHHVTPPVADAAPPPCATEFRLFDHLSRIYGDKFRGSVVFNCMLGVLASATVLYSLSMPIALQGLVNHLPALLESLPTIVEVICLLLIGAIYFRGNTPENDKNSARSRFGAKRWHQRWLEYRLLAERFRYADLLRPLGANLALRLAIAPKISASRLWHERYFKSRVGCAALSAQTVRQYRNHALALIVEQEAYHLQNHRRRGTIARRLETLVKIMFFAALGTCAIHLMAAWDGKAAEESIAWLEFLAALFPVFAAAAYAILTHAEYAKAADSSSETFDRIRELYDKLAAMPVSDIPATEQRLAEMAPFVIEFAETAITEATGWRAMLRDKTIPLL